MRTLIKWGLRSLGLVTCVAILLAVWQKDRLHRLLAVNSLFDEGVIVQNFSQMDKAFLNHEIALPTGSASPLIERSQADLGQDVTDWVIARDVTSLVVLKDGGIAFEDYYLGTDQDDLRIGWSVSKSFLSALFGIVFAEGAIASLDDPVTTYALSLADSAYEDVTIRNVLNMSSGVAFNEDYLDYNSDINKMGRVLALGRSMDGFAENLTAREGTPGEAWRYVSIDTHVLGMVLRGATGRTIPNLMAEKLIGPMGLSAAPYYLTDGDGTAFTLGGLNLTTRDFARLGQMYLQNGVLNGQQIVPRDWVEASTTPSAPTELGEMGYGYQWWIPKDAIEGEFMARGIYGQYVYINREKGLVIATTAADRRFRDEGVADQNIAIFRQIAETLTLPPLDTQVILQ